MRLAVLALLGLLVVAGCAGNENKEVAKQPKQAAPKAKPDAHGPFKPREMRWLKRLRRWEKNHASAYSDVEEKYFAAVSDRKKLSQLRKAVRPLTRCARSMRTKLGEPPTARLEPGFELLLEACEQDRRSGLAYVRAFSSARNATNEQNDAQVKSEALFRRAHDSIESILLANRPLPTARGMSKVSRIEPRFARAVNVVAVHKVEIRCWSKRDWPSTSREYKNYTGVEFDVAGFANPTNYRANIAPDFCARLARFTYKDWRPAGGDDLLKMAQAVGVLAHETEHLSNPRGSEAETECHAMQDVRRVARELGASRSYSALLAKTYWEVIYPQEPPGYGTEVCHNNGPLDFDPETDVWP